MPDGWFVFRDKAGEHVTAVVLETKIQRGTANRDQVEGHIRKAARLTGSVRILVLLVTPDGVDPLPGWKPNGATRHWAAWREVHRFMREATIGERGQTAVHLLADNLTRFLEMHEQVGFTGIPFPDEDYELESARRILKALRSDVRGDVERLYPGLTKGKGNIKEPWDVFASDSVGKFTEGVHLVISVQRECFEVLLTVPNGCRPGWRRVTEVLDDGKAIANFKSLVREARRKLPNLSLVFKQRHAPLDHPYHLYEDGGVELDADTTEFARAAGGRCGVKPNPVLFKLFVEAIRKSPAGINRELNLIARFWYRRHKTMNKPEFKDDVVKALAAFKEIYAFLVPTSTKGRRG